jgi:integrase/recombinase XerD
LLKVGDELGFEINLNSFVVRHSFATKLMLDGTPAKFIREGLGHAYMEINEHYLKSLPHENLKAMSDRLLNFS